MNKQLSLLKRGRHMVRRVQRGVSLLFSLMGLVVLTLGAVALLRSVDSSLLVLGNLGFKQDALAASSAGTEAAIAWLAATPVTTLEMDQQARAYSSVAIPALEAAGPRADALPGTPAVLIDWAGNGCNVPGLNGRAIANCLLAPVELQVGAGNRVKYFITRLCSATGPANAGANNCIVPVVGASAGTSTQRGEVKQGQHVRPTAIAAGTYYRIITRTEGARGTVSFTETLVHF